MTAHRVEQRSERAHVLRSMDVMGRLCQCRCFERSNATPDRLHPEDEGAVIITGFFLGAATAGVNRVLDYFRV